MSKTINIQGIPLYEHQRAVAELVEKHPTGATIVVKSSRQKGKTLLVTQLLLKRALEYKGTNSVIIQPTTAGCRRVMKDMVNMLSRTLLIESANFQYLDLELVNGSIIQFRSGESKDGLRGISLKKNSLLTLDEAAFLDDDVYGIVFPFANVQNCTKLVISTPLFKTGAYYEHYILAKENQLNHYLVDFNEYDCSMLITKDQLDEAKATMSYQQYLNEYCGEFMTESGNVFGDFSKVLSNNINLNNTTYYFGIDWATDRKKDQTAISIFNALKQQVRIVYFNDKDVFETIEIIVELIKQYKPAKVSLEQNSIGQVNYQLLVKELANQHINQMLVKFNTDNTSKRRIIENMVADIKRGSVQLLDDKQMKLELATYEMEATKSGKSITYNAKSGGHDDCIMSTAICLDSMRTAQYAVR